MEGLRPEERVRIAINMTDVCVRISADAIRDGDPSITDGELIEKLRERIAHGRRHHGEA